MKLEKSDYEALIYAHDWAVKNCRWVLSAVMVQYIL